MSDSRIDFKPDKIYHLHLTNDEKLLEIEKQRRKSTRDNAEKHENKLWNFIKSISTFTHLNHKRECKIEFNGEESRVDIVAQSELCRLYIECTIDNSRLKIRETRDKFIEYKRLLALPVNGASEINICQIIYLKEKPTDTLIRLLKEQDVIILTENALEYFITLAEEYKKLAYYQFLNFLFGEKEIKALKGKYKNDKISIKSLKGKDFELGEYYVFSAHPNDLIPISTVPHRKMSSIEDGLSKSYQRLIKKKKIQGIQKHILENKSFPTNLIVHFNNEVDFDGKSLHFTPRFGLINVIDGQHRLFSYIDEYLNKDNAEQNSKKLKKHSENHLITVTAYKKLSLQKQIETFVSINEKQTPVSKNLLWDLYPELFKTTHEDYFKVKISELVKKLNNDQTSRLYFKIRYPSAPYGSKSGPIDLNTICNSITSNQLYYGKASEGMVEGVLHGLFKANLEIDPDQVDECISNTIKTFFESSYEISKTNWDNKFYMTNQYVTSYLMLLKSITKHVITKKNIIKNKNDLDNIKECFIKYLKPAQKYIDEMDNEEMRLFKKGSYGAGGPKGMWLQMIKKINKKYNEFEAKEVENEEDTKHLEDVLERLRNDGESEILEAKESFFIDADTKRASKREEKNEKMTEDIIKTVVAMANGRGGEIILGVGDPANKAYEEWTEVGLNNTDMSGSMTPDKYQNNINSKIKSTADPALLHRVKLNAFFSGGDHFCIIEVKPIPEHMIDNEMFYTIKNTAYYRKNGITEMLDELSRKAHREEMRKALYP
tara:strand:+ start:1905 stop:4223 length:2319 start_codon:yes stop_codon:yes gene_type:complete